MTDYIIHGSTLTDIADAIRTKNPDISGLIDPADMKANILSIPSGSGEPYFPKESLISEFDFIYDYENNKNITYDKIKDDTLVGDFLVSNMQLTANGLLNLGGRFNTGIVPDNDIPLKIVIKFGTFDRSYSLGEYNFIVNFCWDTPDSLAHILWRNEEDRYGLGGDINHHPVRYENSDPYFFENKKIIFLWNCVLRNGQITQYDNGQKVKNRLSIYLEDGTVISEAPYLSYHNKDYFPALILGADDYQYRGAVYEDVKVYALNLEVDPSQDIIQPLNITQNGTYEANGTTIAGYSPITVNVPPTKVLISEFDFKSNSPWYDIVKKGNLGTLMHYGTATQGVGLEFMTTGQRVRTGTIFDYCGVYEMEVKFGTFNKENAPSTGNNFLLCFSRNNYSAMLCFKNYNSETGLGDWWIHDQSGNNIYLDDVHEPYFFENKTLKILFGAKLVDGELVRDFNRIYYYIDDVQLNANGATVAGDVDNSIGVVHLGDRQSATFKGAVFEGFKIWQYFDKY